MERVTGPPWPFARISSDARYVRWEPCASGQGPGRDSPQGLMNSLRDMMSSYRAVPATATSRRAPPLPQGQRQAIPSVPPLRQAHLPSRDRQRAD